MKRVLTLLILILVILLSVGKVFAQDDDNETATDSTKFSLAQNTPHMGALADEIVGNGIYEVFVDHTLNIGAYTARTGVAHPVTLATGARQNVLFGGSAGNPSSSFNTIRSYTSGTDYVQRANTVGLNSIFDVLGLTFPNIPADEIDDYVSTELISTTGYRTTYRLPGPPITPDALTIVQEINVVGTTYEDSRIMVSISVTNEGNSTVEIGMRYLWDFQVAGDDGPTFTPVNPTGLPLDYESAFAPPGFSFFRMQSNQTSLIGPGFTVNGTANGPSVFNPSTPDLLQFSAWTNAAGQAFDVTLNPNRLITQGLRTLTNDSAVNYFFGATEDTAIPVLPGNTTTRSAYLFAIQPSANTPPVAMNDTVNVPGNQTSNIFVLENDFDLDDDPIAVVGVSPTTQGGTVEILNNGAQIAYTPPAGYFGEDSFSYTIGDGTGATSTAQVFVTVEDPNDPPVAVDDTVTVQGGQTTNIDVLANDSDPNGDDILVSIVMTTAQGADVVITFPDYQIAYTPPAGFFGEDNFFYTIVDTFGATDTAQVFVTVQNPNGTPVANADSASTVENTPVTVNVLANDSDPDGDTLTVIDVIQGGSGTAVINADNTVTFTPNAGIIGSLTPAFTYVISDGNGGTAQAPVNISVGSSNRPPIAVDDSATTTINTPVTIDVLANDVEPDGNPRIIESVTAPANGTANITPGGGSVDYIPNAGFLGTDTFQYTINDGNGLTSTATVTVNVVAPVCAPGNPAYDPAADLKHEQSLLLPETGYLVGRIVNRSQTCAYAVGMASYEIIDGTIDTQILFNSSVNVIAPGATLDLQVTAPDCARQIDLFYGDLLTSLNGQRYAERLLGAIVLDRDNWCRQVVGSAPGSGTP